VLQFSTHFGGGWNTDARAIIDSQGNAWFAVTTERIDLPVSPDAAQGPIVPSDPNCRNEFSARCLEVWIAKIAPSGQILRSTYLGGFSGATAAGLALDASGAVWVAGTTASTDFPQIQPIAGATAKPGVFVAKLTPDLTRVVSATAIPVSLFSNLVMTLDAAGFIYVAGGTVSGSVLLKNAFQADFRGGSDGFLMKLDPTGATLVYSTLFGGTGFDSITAVAVDDAGSAVVAGQTGSSDFPVKGAVQSTFAGGFSDGFVARFAADGQLSWSTYSSGAAGDTLQAVALNGGGDVYTSGYADLPGSVRAATLTRYTADGRSMVFAKTLPGANGFASLAFDPQGNLWAFGETLAPLDAPAVSPDAFQDQPAGSIDTLLAEWSPAG
jgi:hypothetical protein